MFRFISTAADYPMPYTDSTGSTFDALLGVPLGLVFVLTAIVCAAIISVGAANEGLGMPMPRGSVAAAVAAGIVALVTGFCFGNYCFETGRVDVAADTAARIAYDKSVISWLETDYGIIIDRHALGRLTGGKTLVVEYDGADTMIEFAERADKGLAVRIPDGQLLAHIDR